MKDSPQEDGGKATSHAVESFNYDEILEHIGPMGKFPLRSFLLLCFPALFFGPVIMNYVFVGAIPPYR